MDGSHAPETPAPQPAHADHSAVSAVVDARSLPATAPYLSRQESTSKARGKKAQAEPTEPKAPPAQPSSEMAWGTRKCLAWFDYWRGSYLIGKFSLMQASTCAKGLAEQFDEQTVIDVHRELETRPYYIAKGGCDVCDVAKDIGYVMKKQKQAQKPVPPTSITPFLRREDLKKIPV